MPRRKRPFVLLVDQNKNSFKPDRKIPIRNVGYIGICGEDDTSSNWCHKNVKASTASIANIFINPNDKFDFVFTYLLYRLTLASKKNIPYAEAIKDISSFIKEANEIGKRQLSELASMWASRPAQDDLQAEAISKKLTKDYKPKIWSEYTTDPIFLVYQKQIENEFNINKSCEIGNKSTLNLKNTINSFALLFIIRDLDDQLTHLKKTIPLVAAIESSKSVGASVADSSIAAASSDTNDSKFTQEFIDTFPEISKILNPLKDIKPIEDNLLACYKELFIHYQKLFESLKKENNPRLLDEGIKAITDHLKLLSDPEIFRNKLLYNINYAFEEIAQAAVFVKQQIEEHIKLGLKDPLGIWIFYPKTGDIKKDHSYLHDEELDNIAKIYEIIRFYARELNLNYKIELETHFVDIVYSDEDLVTHPEILKKLQIDPENILAKPFEHENGSAAASVFSDRQLPDQRPRSAPIEITKLSDTSIPTPRQAYSFDSKKPPTLSNLGSGSETVEGSSAKTKLPSDGPSASSLNLSDHNDSDRDATSSEQSDTDGVEDALNDFTSVARALVAFSNRLKKGSPHLKKKIDATRQKKLDDLVSEFDLQKDKTKPKHKSKSHEKGAVGFHQEAAALKQMSQTKKEKDPSPVIGHAKQFTS